MEPITAETVFRLIPNPTQTVRKDIKLTGEQWELLRLINGKNTVGDLARLRQQALKGITRTVAELMQFGLIQRAGPRDPFRSLEP